MGHAIPKQHPAVVLRSHFNLVRALLGVAMVALVGLVIALVIVANDDNESGPRAPSRPSRRRRCRPRRTPPTPPPRSSPPTRRRPVPAYPTPGRHARPELLRAGAHAQARRLDGHPERRAGRPGHPLRRRPRGGHPRPCEGLQHELGNRRCGQLARAVAERALRRRPRGGHPRAGLQLAPKNRTREGPSSQRALFACGDQPGTCPCRPANEAITSPKRPTDSAPSASDRPTIAVSTPASASSR